MDNKGISPGGKSATPFAELDPETRMDKADFKELLVRIDSGLRALPATAQVAAQNLMLKFGWNRTLG